MVTAVGGRSGDGGRLILSPRAPMTRRATLVLFLAVSTPILGVAIVCAMLGAWQVLLMSSLVVVAVAAGLLSGYRRTQIDEVVSIVGDTVAVDKHLRHATEHHEFQRGWAQVVLEEPRPPMEEFPSRLFIRSHGRQVQIGGFLDDDERRELAARLQRTMGPSRPFESCGGG
ncbi:MAG: DUF2244 domain-containing protein [Rhodocyclales bacterium]|nr:DUF2244 domain-containing protein [Rhodocyclales bacterium]